MRVVLDFKDVKDHTIFYLENPTRLVVDVRGARRAACDGDRGAGPRPRAVASRSPSRRPAPDPSPPVDDGVPPGSPPGRRARAPARRAGGPRLAAACPLPPSAVSPSPSSVRRRPPAVRPLAAPGRRRAGAAAARRRRAPTRTPAGTPQVNRAGSYSLARQLGLGARRIVIDAGHGGHDPGTIGRGGLQEKDLVLDVALRLERLVRDELGAEVVMTRATDVFVPARGAHRRSPTPRGADLFLSIHANAAATPRARGIETYFLSFAQDPHAEAVAARENAISAATLKDLQSLVKAIALNSKIDESRDFATSVQEAMVQHHPPARTPCRTAACTPPRSTS